MVNAALSGELTNITCHEDPIFRVMVPDSCPGLKDNSILDPVNTWDDKEAYRVRAHKLAAEFRAHFDKAYGNKGISKEIEGECPRS